MAICCNRRGGGEQHTSHVTFSSWVTMTHVAQAQVWRAQRTFHVISCVIFMRSCCVFDSPRLSLSLFAVYLSLLSSCSPTLSRMWWTNPLCTSAHEDLGNLAEYDPLTILKKKLDQLDNCPQFAHKLFFYVCTWLVLVDPIFYGL